MIVIKYDIVINVFEIIPEYVENLYNNRYFILCEDRVIYNNDGTFNRVRIEENIFVNISKVKMIREVRILLKDLIGQSFVIKESGQKVYIGKDFPGEYVYSKYTVSLNYSDKIVKFRIIDNFDDIIENAAYRKYSNDHREKHKIDAKYGFYKYRIVFSIVYKCEEKFYDGILLIRNDADGKKYLYDILDIKEKN